MPPASLYRHINALSDGGVVAVVDPRACAGNARSGSTRSSRAREASHYPEGGDADFVAILADRPGPGRRRRMLTTVVMPTPTKETHP